MLSWFPELPFNPRSPFRPTTVRDKVQVRTGRGGEIPGVGLAARRAPSPQVYRGFPGTN